MIKFVVLFFACVVASTTFQNSLTPLIKIFKNGAIPTAASVRVGIEESIVVAKNLFDKKIIQLPDIYEAFVDEHDHLFKVHLTSGQFTGVETLYSIDAPTASVNKNYGFLIAPYRYANFTVTYNYAVKYKGERIEGKVIAEESGFRCDIGFLTDRLTLKVSSYNIKCENHGPINVKLGKKTNEDKRSKKIIKASVSIFKDLIEDVTKETLEQVIIDALNENNSVLSIM